MTVAVRHRRGKRLNAGMRRMQALLALAATLAGASAALGAEAFDKGLLFRVSRPGTPPSYVFGVIHAADPRVIALAPPVIEALATTHSFAPELGTVLAVVGPELEDAENLPRGAELQPLVGEAVYVEVRARLVAQGVPEATIARLKPWAALLRISRVGAAAQGVTLDQALLEQAGARRMHIVPLESIEEQVAAFDSIPLDTQVALLRYTVANIDTLAADSDAVIDAWLRRDLREIKCISERPGARDLVIAPHFRVLCRHIITNRTALLHYRLELPLRAGRVFVAIGASHLPGEEGLLRMLERDGYTVTRVW